ncbi:hypothetical protein ACFPYI_07850 [Halomarina salina]|uniref:Uncharacterized protein n=1 Tax=Halomarina salina TaxID=1872699 RepID=A0ABD5RLH5_9EURY|nr:hypothetical protein [Halomarina salina]
MNRYPATAYDDASYQADAAVVAAAVGDFGAASDHVRSAFAALRSSPYTDHVEAVHRLGVDAAGALAAPDADRDRVVALLETFRTAVERCHERAVADVRAR